MVVRARRREGGPDLVLRGLRLRDRAEWEALRAANAGWLAPWEAAPPHVGRTMKFSQVVRTWDREAERGRLQPFAIEVEGRLVGQIHLGPITWGSLRSAGVGYWVAEHVAGRGIGPTALAAVVDHAFVTLGLHRVEANVRPDNAASLSVVRKLGFRDEGLRSSYMFVDDAWRDHRSFALTVEDLAGASLLESWNASAVQITPM